MSGLPQRAPSLFRIGIMGRIIRLPRPLRDNFGRVSGRITGHAQVTCSISEQGLHRCASTISREVARRGGRAQYRANEADQQAWESALRPKPCLLATHTTLREIVASKLMQDWSPEQVSGWLKWQFPKDEGLRVSHETIYRSLFLQARGALKKELIQHFAPSGGSAARGIPAFMDTPKARSSMPCNRCYSPKLQPYEQARLAWATSVNRTIAVRSAKSASERRNLAHNIL